MHRAWFRIAVAVGLMVPLIAAVRYWFVCDDAFIAFRYVRNLLLGEGLVWNPGERVEGYTSFLWVVELAGLWAVGARPEVAAPWLGLAWTLVTGLGVVALAARSPHPRRDAVVLIALAWWATNRSVAVWATSGLETRQFSALSTWALLLLARGTPGGWWSGSTLVGLAVLTRPEGLLAGPVLIAWTWWDRWCRGQLDRRTVLATSLPAGAVVVAHLLWRRAYYGEWLPNTYYAKAVRDWWEAGFTWLGYAAIEHALWLIVPLALVGTWTRWRDGDRIHLALWAWCVPSYLHLAKIGGDHFEFRMLDEWWPVAYVAAADGLVALLAQARVGWTVAAAVVVTGYGLVIPLSHDRLAFQRHGRDQTERLSIHLDAAASPWIVAFPPTVWLAPTYNQWGDYLAAHSVGLRHREHQAFADLMRARYAHYAAIEDTGLFEPDAVAAQSSIGYFGFYLWDLTVIDTKGLCDRTIARAPVDRTDAQRQLAHDRSPPPGYLAERGVNLVMDGAYRSRETALGDGPFAVRVADGVWGAFDVVDPDYLARAFPGREVVDRMVLASPYKRKASAPGPEETSFAADGHRWTVARWLGRFDDGLDGWALTGDAFATQPARGTWIGQGDVRGWEGTGLLNSYHPSWADRLTGTATSPPFTPAPGEALTFLHGGGRAGARVALIGPEGELAAWTGRSREALDRVVLPLDPWVGQPLRLEARDEGTGPFSHVLLDAVAVVVSAP